ncbi:hypothetical protein [Marinicellulosiphila megalodicopiae]|uniref:hypothetical protein n=1 Tax=Marinicellulosiphila megalodicopiae TaxID=2724896 RepID=UPI003BB1F4FB
MKPFYILIFLLFCTKTFAFDQKRKGTFIDLGLGVNILNSDLTQRSNSIIQSFNDAGMSGSIRIGSGLVKKVSIFSDINHRHYLSQSDQGNYFITDIGLGVQYYFTKYVQTFYVMGSFSTSVVGFSEEKISLGRTFKSGVGYEFTPRWQAELTYQDTASEINHTLFDHLESKSVQFTIHFLWY